MHLDCSKFNCVACCEKYWITVLPEEAENAAVLLGLSLRDFLQKYCVLCIQLFPFPLMGSKLFLSKNFLPKKVSKKLEKETDAVYFLALPSIALKRSKKGCVFLKNGLCGIYNARPKQCELFPFISLNGEKNFAEKYPFCRALFAAKFEKKFLKESFRHYAKVRSHFNEVGKKGFENALKSFPKSGIVLFKDKFVCRVSEKAFFKILKSFGKI